MGNFEIIIIILGILFKYLLGYGINQIILYLLLLIISIFTFLYILHLKLNEKEWKSIIFFLIISLFFIITQKDVNFYLSVLFTCLIFKKDDKEFIKVFLITSTCLFLLTILLNRVGIIESQNLVRYKDDGKIIRYSLGFEHPNLVFLYFMPIALGSYYLFNDNKKYYLVLFITSTILYKLSDCRTGYICILLIPLLHIIITNKLLNKKFIQFLIKNILLIFTTITIIVSIKYGYDNTNTVSTLLSGRPYYLNYYLKNNLVFTLFGGNFTSKYVIDNFYLYLLIQLGLLGYYIYYKIYKEGIKYLILDKKYIVILIEFCIYGLLETNVIIGSINFLFPLLIKKIIVNYERKTKYEKWIKTKK